MLVISVCYLSTVIWGVNNLCPCQIRETYK